MSALALHLNPSLGGCKTLGLTSMSGPATRPLTNAPPLRRLQRIHVTDVSKSLTRSGVDLIEKHLPAGLQTMELRHHLYFYTGCLAIARSLGDGSVKLSLPASHPLASSEGTVDAPALADWFTSEIDRPRGMFDNRGVNTYQTEEGHQRLSWALVDESV